MAAMSGVLARCTVRSAFVDILRMAMAAYNPRRAIAIEHGEVIGDALEALCHIFPQDAGRERWERCAGHPCPAHLWGCPAHSREKYERAALPKKVVHVHSTN